MTFDVFNHSLKIAQDVEEVVAPAKKAKKERKVKNDGKPLTDANGKVEPPVATAPTEVYPPPPPRKKAAKAKKAPVVEQVEPEAEEPTTRRKPRKYAVAVPVAPEGDDKANPTIKLAKKIKKAAAVATDNVEPTHAVEPVPEVKAKKSKKAAVEVIAVEVEATPVVEAVPEVRAKRSKKAKTADESTDEAKDAVAEQKPDSKAAKKSKVSFLNSQRCTFNVNHRECLNSSSANRSRCLFCMLFSELAGS